MLQIPITKFLMTLARQNCPLSGRNLSQLVSQSVDTFSELCRRLTDDLKQVGKQDDLLGRPRPVRPVAEQRPGQEAAEAERRQDQTQKVGRRIQRLQVPPHRGQDHSWSSRGRAVLVIGRQRARFTNSRMSAQLIKGSILPNELLTTWAALTHPCNEPRAETINHAGALLGFFRVPIRARDLYGCVECVKTLM